MIYVKRLIGECFDFETGRETSKAIVVSNGSREVFVEIGDEAVKSVLQLFIEDGAEDTSVITLAKEPEPKQPERNTDEFEHPGGSYEPGEEYDDILTGAGSI